jgi:hypothetical protein
VSASRKQGRLTVAAPHWRRLLGIALTIASISLLAACGGSHEPPSSKQALKWSVAESKGPRQVTVRGSVSHCDGLPEPRVLEVVKRYRARNVFVRILIDVPAEARDESEFLCAGLGWPIEETISLPRPLNELVLFDSGVDPPAQRWPETPSK